MPSSASCSRFLIAGLAGLGSLSLTVRAAADDEFSANPADPNYKRPIAGYVPDVSAAALFALFFTILTVMTVLHYIKRRMVIWLPIGLAGMSIGYGIRVLSHFKAWSIPVYAASKFLILLTPCAMLAACYQLLGLIADALGPDTIARDCLPIRTTRIAKIFVTVDIITFIVQLAGSGLSIQDGTAGKIGMWTALVGIVIQLISLSGFIAIFVLFGQRIRSRHVQLWYHHDSRFSWSPKEIFSWQEVDNWKVAYLTTLVASVLLWIRCVYRAAEYGGGHDGAIATNEVWMYLLDALPILVAMTGFAYFWPARFLAIQSEADGSSSGGHGLAPMVAPTQSYESSAYSEQTAWSSKPSKSYQQV